MLEYVRFHRSKIKKGRKLSKSYPDIRALKISYFFAAATVGEGVHGKWRKTKILSVENKKV